MGGCCGRCCAVVAVVVVVVVEVVTLELMARSGVAHISNNIAHQKAMA